MSFMYGNKGGKRKRRNGNFCWRNRNYGSQVGNGGKGGRGKAVTLEREELTVFRYLGKQDWTWIFYWKPLSRGFLRKFFYHDNIFFEIRVTFSPKNSHPFFFSPEDNRHKPFRSLLFDSWYGNEWSGVVCLVKVSDGTVKIGMLIFSPK